MRFKFNYKFFMEKGNACDFNITRMSALQTAELIVAMDLPYDQVIHEFGRWVHLGVADILRGQELTAYRKDGKTRYGNGILTMEDV